MDLILFFQAILQGIVQGITEWLPISSTGHIKLLDALWPMSVSADFMEVFEVVIQLGSILAVLVLYFHKLNPVSPKKTPQQKKDTVSLWGKVVVASIPVAVIGLLIDDPMNELFKKNPTAELVTIASTLIIYGVAFIVIESTARKPKVASFEQMSYKTALLIGLFETLALIPGTSRSGATILGAVLIGTSRTVAAEFSFFMAMPAMLGASGIKLLKLLLDGVSVTGNEWISLGVATVVAFAVSVFAIRFLMGFIQKHDFKPFGYYRIVLGLVIVGCLCFCPTIFH